MRDITFYLKLQLLISVEGKAARDPEEEKVPASVMKKLVRRRISTRGKVLKAEKHLHYVYNNLTSEKRREEELTKQRRKSV
jgi:hypothetical protein